MKKKQKGLKSVIGQDCRGLSIVELICAIAIFSMVTAIIGTVIVVSTRTYNRGITETSLQQEAQLAANRISTIVQDACEATYVKNDGDGTKTLTLVTNEPDPVKGNTYTIRYNGGQLLYSDAKLSDVPLADKIEKFEVYTLGGDFKEDEFKNTRTLYLDMQVKSNDKIYNVNYAISARNEMTVDIPDGPAEVGASIFCDADVILVPGETYKIPIDIEGRVTQGVEAGFFNATTGGLDNAKDGIQVVSCDMDGITVVVDQEIAVDDVILTVQTKDTWGTPPVPKKKVNIQIRIRRVKDVKVTYNINTSGVAEKDPVTGMWDTSKSDYTHEAKGAVYTFYANVSVKNPDQVIDADFEKAVEPTAESGRIGYQKPRQIEWETEFAYVRRSGDAPDGEVLEKNPLLSVTETEGNKTTITYYEGTHPEGDCLKIEYVNDPNETVPKAVCTLLADWQSNLELTMTAKSRHADGLNKASSDYDDVSDSVTIRPRATKINKPEGEFVLEPNEDVYVPISLKGARNNNLDCYVAGCTNAYGATPESSATWVKIPSNDVKGTDDDSANDRAYYGDSTYAKYVSNKQAVKIHIGKDELANKNTNQRWFWVAIIPAGKGLGNPDFNNIPKTGSDAVFVKVYVRRVEWLKMSYKTPAGNKPEDQVCLLPLKKNATYQFKVDMMEQWNLKEKSTLENDKTKYISPYAAEISWYFKKGGSTSMVGKYVCTNLDEVIDKNGHKVNPSGKSIGDIVEGSYKNEYLEIIALYKTSDGPCIKVRLLQDFPSDAEFTVTATALHPLGTYDYRGVRCYENRTGEKYADVSDSVTLNGVFGETKDIVADPAQGTTADARYELCVPIDIQSNIGVLDAQIVGNMKDGTKVLTTRTVVPSSKGTAYVYLAIDPAETGGGKGSYKMPNSNEEISYDLEEGDMLLLLNARAVGVHESGVGIGQAEIPIHLRRVKTVEIDEDTNSGTQLVLNGNVTEGYGDKWTDYFKKQDAAWDSAYKTPYSYKWELSHDGGKTWIPLNAGTPKDSYIQNYIDSIQIVNPTDSNNATEGILTLNLKKKLEDGVQIKMTSRHSIGENRGGQPYDKEVYDIYIIKNNNNLIDAGWMRGNDNNQLNAGFTSHKNNYPHEKQQGFFRYREVGGEWKCGYRSLTDRSEIPVKFDVADAWLLEPDKDYEVEVIMAVFSESDKKLYWPHDESLLADGAGWKEAGFTKGWTGNDTTDPSEYRRNYFIGKSYLVLDKGSNIGSRDIGLTVGDRYFTPYNTSSNPLKIKTGETLQINLEQKYFHLGNYQSNFRPKLQKFDGTKWVDVAVNGSDTSEGWTLQTSCPNYQIYNIKAEHKGQYRIGIFIDNLGKWKRIDESQSAWDQLFNPQYKEFSLTTILHDWSSGDGVLYFNINMD